jgi:CBS domain-containing protein
MKPDPIVREYMTPVPKVIPSDLSIAEAYTYMRKLHLSHIPAAQGGKIVGIISNREIRQLLAIGGTALGKEPVSLLIESKPASIAANLPLKDVLSQLESQDCSALLVMEGARVVGLFTVENALRAFLDFLRDS